jgi:hypothetical protein
MRGGLLNWSASRSRLYPEPSGKNQWSITRKFCNCIPGQVVIIEKRRISCSQYMPPYFPLIFISISEVNTNLKIFPCARTHLKDFHDAKSHAAHHHRFCIQKFFPRGAEPPPILHLPQAEQLNQANHARSKQVFEYSLLRRWGSL